MTAPTTPSPAAPSAAPPFLPRLDPDFPAGARAARWSALGGDELVKFAGHITLPEDAVGPDKVERLSLPSPWARALLFEHTLLYRNPHPARAQIRGEWRGLLGLIALSELFGQGQLTVQHVPLRGTPLAEMYPGGWPAAAEMSLLYWNRQLVGSSSPVTLVFTGRRPLDPARVQLPFLRAGRLADPLEVYRPQPGEVASASARRVLLVLTAWVRRTYEAVRDRAALDAALGRLAGEGGGVSRRRRLEEELRAWYGECAATLGGEAEARERTAELELDAGAELFRAPLDFVHPLRVEAAVEPHPFALASAPATIVDPAGGRLLDRAGNPVHGRLPVRGAVEVDVAHGEVHGSVARTLLAGERRLALDDLFEERLIKLLAPDEEVDPAFARLLVAGGTRYFLPLRVEVAAGALDDATLATVTAEDRRDRGVVAVRLDLPLQGERVLRFEREYPRHGGVVEVALSNLWVWPNFERAGWKSYFWANAAPPAAASNAARFEPVAPAAGETRAEFAPDGAAGTRWGLSDRPLRLWQVTAAQGAARAGAGYGNGSAPVARGLLVVRPPNVTAPGAPDDLELWRKPWRVAVDFGSTHTLAFVKPKGADEARELPLANRTVRVLGPGRDVEFNFFTFRQEPATPPGAPTLLWMPADRPVNPRDFPHKRWLPGHGLAFYGTDVKGRSWTSLRSDLKWRPMAGGPEKLEADLAFKNYLSHFCLLIGAEAAAREARLETVYASYPGVFSQNQREAFEATLQAAVAAANPALPAGVEVNSDGEEETTNATPNGERAAEVQRIAVELPCDEATALEAYFAHRRVDVEGQGLFAVDVGGSTSDFVIRRVDAEPVYASIRFAGNVVNRIIGADRRTVEAVAYALRSDFVGLPAPQVERISRLLTDPEKRAVGAGLLIRTLAATGGDGETTRKFAKALLSAGPDGQRVLAAVAYLFATNAFFMGLMAYPMEPGREEEGYVLHLAGRGALLLDWISALRNARDANGATAGEQLVAHFFRAGLSVDDTIAGRPPVACAVKVRLPEADSAKREVATGLLNLPDSLLHGRGLRRGDDGRHANPIAEFRLAAEDGTEVPWNTPLTYEVLRTLRAPKLGFKAGKLPVFAAFVQAFGTLNLGIRELDFVRLLRLTPATLDDAELSGRIRAVFFGEGSAWKEAQTEERADEMLVIEPFFVSAAKAMLEFGLGVQQPLFTAAGRG
ncbi:hypothetical protein tb265_14900 [Gemmatimonadetes bacterium T265]|nr:hypothetical protein tb265_14900 [Gemmatimonadetes bacterium T265]